LPSDLLDVTSGVSNTPEELLERMRKLKEVSTWFRV
jgi:hypothetical protein